MADIAVVCARCQPPTRAHFAALAHAATLAPRVVLLMLNADDACSPANPFDNDMRLTLLRAALDDAVTVLMLRDRRYEPLRWAAAAEATLRAVAGEGAVVVLGDVDNASTSLPLPDTWQRAEEDVQLAAAEAAARGALLRRPTRVGAPHRHAAGAGADRAAHLHGDASLAAYRRRGALSGRVSPRLAGRALCAGVRDGRQRRDLA